jgi:hypothetical protein
MSGSLALKDYKPKLSIDKLASIGAYIYIFDMLKGGPLNIILGFLSMIAPWVTNHASATATILIPPLLKHPNMPGSFEYSQKLLI